MTDAPVSDDGSSRHSRAPKKRSLLEKSLVWGGIVALLAVVGLEWSSKKHYEESLAALESAVQAYDSLGNRVVFLVDDAASHIHGFPSRKDEGEIPRRKVIYKWPSLFKTYSVLLMVNDAQVVTEVRSQTGADDNFEKPLPGKASSQPSDQLASAPDPLRQRVKTGERVLDLVAQRNQVPTQAGIRYGSLVRELVRQAFLVAARDELGLSTRDSTFGEVVVVEEGTSRFPLQISSILRYQPDPSKPAVVIEITRLKQDGKLFRTTRTIAFESMNLEDLVSKLEQASREDFVKILNEAGFQQVKRTREASQQKAASAVVPMEIVSQFGELRRLHAELTSTGDSNELLEGLIKTYANLGDLTSFYLSVMSKAYKARSMIYAQRYVNKSNGTASALSCRAYARALAGRHAAALDDVNAVAELPGQTAPEWLPLIKAFCSYETEVLSREKGPQEHLALYLLMRSSKESGSMDRAVAAIEKYLTVEPASFRAYESLCELDQLGTIRMAIDAGFDNAWGQIYERMESIPNLPKPVQLIVQEQALRDRINPAREHKSRAELFKALRQAGADASDESEPSWNMLANVLEEATFAQIVETLYCEKMKLSVSSENSIRAFRPLVAEHRWKAFIEGFTDNPQSNAATLSKLVQQISSADAEPQMNRFLTCIYTIGGRDVSRTLSHGITSNNDLIFDDFSSGGMGSIGAANQGSVDMLKVSPHWPSTIAAVIQFDWNAVEKNGPSWIEKYANCPRIMVALGQRYMQHHKPDEAIRCFRKSIAVEPSLDAYEALANLLQAQGDMVAYEQTLKDSLQVDDFGLRKARIASGLAETMMQRGDWKGAQPYAMQAAQSYSAWGLLTGSRCAEGLRDWRTAESMRRAISERYAGNQPDWFFWCIRTGRGNLKKARALAEEYWQTFVPPYQPAQTDSLFYRALIDGQTQQAFDLLQDLIKEPENLRGQDGYQLDPRRVFHSALLADELNNIEVRDKTLKDLPRLSVHHAYTQLIDLASLCLRAVQDPDHPVWDENAFEELAVGAIPDEVTFLYFAAGDFLVRHKLADIGRRYLQVSATSSGTEKRSCMVSSMLLRKMGDTVGPMRASELPDELARIGFLLANAERERGRQKYDLAEQQLNEAFALRPGFSPTLVRMAALNTDMGRYSEAVRNFEDALQSNPDSPITHRLYATFLATCADEKSRDGAKALKHAEIASSKRPVSDYKTLSALAAAFAESNQFDKAVEYENRAIAVAPAYIGDYQRLQHYQKKMPFHEPAPQSREKQQQPTK